MSDRLLLLLDVDGVLNTRRGGLRTRPKGARTLRRPMRHSPGFFITYWLNPAHEPLLHEVACVFDLVWASAWEGTANQYLAAHLGLPELPFVDFGVSREWNDPLPPETARFSPTRAEAVGAKTPRVAAFADGRDFVLGGRRARVR